MSFQSLLTEVRTAYGKYTMARDYRINQRFSLSYPKGAVSLRTHNSNRVVNRSSRFHTSAGLEDLKCSVRGNSTALSQPGSPSSSPIGPLTSARDCPVVGKNGLVNPRMPPLPNPDVLTPYIQVKLGASSR